MPSKTVTVGSAVGLHARPAALIAEAVSKSGVPVTLATPGGNAIDGVLGFLTALLAGTVVGGLAVMVAKQIGRTPASATV